jgi:hypothetical protein
MQRIIEIIQNIQINIYVGVETRMSDRNGRRFFSRISHDCQAAKIKFIGASIATTGMY